MHNGSEFQSVRGACKSEGVMYHVFFLENWKCRRKAWRKRERDSIWFHAYHYGAASTRVLWWKKITIHQSSLPAFTIRKKWIQVRKLRSNYSRRAIQRSVSHPLVIIRTLHKEMQLHGGLEMNDNKSDIEGLYAISSMAGSVIVYMRCWPFCASYTKVALAKRLSGPARGNGDDTGDKAGWFSSRQVNGIHPTAPAFFVCNVVKTGIREPIGMHKHKRHVPAICVSAMLGRQNISCPVFEACLDSFQVPKSSVPGSFRLCRFWVGP